MGENIKSFSTETQNLFNAWKNGNATIADVFQSSITDLSNMKSQQEALTLPHALHKVQYPLPDIPFSSQKQPSR